MTTRGSAEILFSLKGGYAMATKRSTRKKEHKSTAPAQETAKDPEHLNDKDATPEPEVPAVPEAVSVPGPVVMPEVPADPEPVMSPAPAISPAATKRSGDATSQTKTFEVVEFSLENEQFAIDLFDVKEVVEYTTITKLPNVPPYIRGIIDLRGEITTIIDLRNRLSLKESNGTAQENSRIIVLDSTVARTKTGILVDDVTSVATFETSQVDYTSGAMNSEDTAIRGIIKKKVKVQDRETSELIIWLDIRKLIEEIDEV
jgi:purine-binding chemotaxis protein CheW